MKIAKRSSPEISMHASKRPQNVRIKQPETITEFDNQQVAIAFKELAGSVESLAKEINTCNKDMINMSTLIHNMDIRITKIEKTIKQNTFDIDISENQNTEKYSDTVDSDVNESDTQIIDEIRTPPTVEVIDVIELP